MKKRYYRKAAPPSEELIASFGEARLVKTSDGKLEINGGSPTDRTEAEVWVSRFLTPAKDAPPSCSGR
jgi:hypothetical protein